MNSCLLLTLTLAGWSVARPLAVLVARSLGLAAKQIAHLAVVLDDTVNVQVVAHHVTTGWNFWLLAGYY